MSPSSINLHLFIALAALFTSSNATGLLERRSINLVASGLVPQASDTNLPFTGLLTDSATSSFSLPATDFSSLVPGSTPSSDSSIIPSTSSSSDISLSSSSTSTTSSSSSEVSSSTSVSITSVPQTTVVVVVTTDGSIYTSSSTSFSTSVLPTQSGSVSPDQSGSGSTSGPNKTTIIGATVGIGGAIILAGLGFVAWRLWGKNRNHSDEDEILMNGSSAHGEKLTTSSSNPFKSTLEQHHAHTGTNF